MALILLSLIILCIMPTVSFGARDNPDHQQAVLVMNVKTIGLPHDYSTTLTEQLAGTIHQIGKYNVSSSIDLSRQLELEQQKDLFGCDDITCQAELAGALGAELIVTATVSKEQGRDYYFLSLILKDNMGVKTINRISTSIYGQLHNVMEGMEYHIYRLFNERPPKKAKIAARQTAAVKQAKAVVLTPQELELKYRKSAKFTTYIGLGTTVVGLSLLTTGLKRSGDLENKSWTPQIEYAKTYKQSRNLMISGGTVAAVGISSLIVSMVFIGKANTIKNGGYIGAAVDSHSALLTFSGEF